jgi:hypothetical protein
MQRCERALEVVHDLGFGLDGVGAGLRLLFGSGGLVEDVRGHAIVVGGQVLDLLGKGTDAGKLTCGWRIGIFLHRHGIGSGNHPIFGVGDPEIERLTNRANRRRLVVLRACRTAANQ